MIRVERLLWSLELGGVNGVLLLCHMCCAFVIFNGGVAYVGCANGGVANVVLCKWLCVLQMLVVHVLL